MTAARLTTNLSNFYNTRSKLGHGRRRLAECGSGMVAVCDAVGGRDGGRAREFITGQKITLHR